MNKSFISFLTSGMSEENKNEGTPGPGDNNNNEEPVKQGNDTKSEDDVLALNTQNGGVVAKRVIARGVSASRYSDIKAVSKFKNLMLERDNELYFLAMKYQEQEAHIKGLRQEAAVRNRDTASLRQQHRDATQMCRNLTVALSVVNSCAQPAAKPEIKKAEMTSSGTQFSDQEEEEDKDEGASNNEYKFFFHDPLFKNAVNAVETESLDMTAESSQMTPSSEIDIDGNILLYPVPTHLMGLIVGKGRRTLRRIYFQTHTEIEQHSWVIGEGPDAKRVMGFKIQGAPDAIKAAIDEMVDVIATMNKDKAVNMIKWQQKKNQPATPDQPKPSTSGLGSAKPKPGASGIGSVRPKTGGSTPRHGGFGRGGRGGKGGRRKNSTNTYVCRFIKNGICPFGDKCRNVHPNNPK